MIFVLASNNPGKLKEMKAMMSGMGYEIISQREAGFALEVEETGTTFLENAFLKAEAACAMSGLPAVADDSGLVVEALGGEPGVYSARYAGEDKTDKERNIYLLEKMKDKEDRSAKFVSEIACVFPNGDRLSARGECSGVIIDEERGESGFGYDPTFLFPELGLTMAEISPETKNRISHRAKAMEAFGAKLREYLDRSDGNADK